MKYVVTRSAGYDHMELAAMKQYGLRGANVPFYSPWAISEHAILTASLLRLAKAAEEDRSRRLYAGGGAGKRAAHHDCRGVRAPGASATRRFPI